MPESDGAGRPGTWERVVPDCSAPDTPPDLSGDDLAHLFDYCRALLGQDAEAIRTARSVLASPHEPLPDTERLRAWFFGLARSLARSLRAPGSDERSYQPPPLIAESSQQADSGVRRAFGALTDRDREILDLVYRHGIRPADLPAVLIVPAEEVYRCLVSAEHEFISLAAGAEAGLVAYPEDIAALPLAALPAVRNDDDEPKPEYPPAPEVLKITPSRPAAPRPVKWAAAALIPVAAILCWVVFLAAPGHPAASPGAAVSAGGSASRANLREAQRVSSHPGSSKHGSAPGQPDHLAPVTAPTAMPDPSSTSVITGLAQTVSAVPCPPGTKASFRWHYAASGGGGWSGTATHTCPGSVTMGPQAMAGNLQVSSGTTLQAGYDFTLPGNNKSLTMTVSAARVTFAVSCVSKAPPSAATLTVPLQPQTYKISSAQWYPSGDQSSPLVYQGSVAVPALCGPGGEISLASGGTFAATLS